MIRKQLGNYKICLSSKRRVKNETSTLDRNYLKVQGTMMHILTLITGSLASVDSNDWP